MQKPRRRIPSPSLIARTAALTLLFACGLLGACGGEQIGSFGGSSSGGVGGSGGGGTSSSGGSGGSGGVSNEPDGATCVNVDISAFDRSCQHVSDCAYVAGGGEICDGYCNCGQATISASAVRRYEEAISAVTHAPEPCPCSQEGFAVCRDNLCTLCAPAGCP
jgi:hypothetical protein